MIYTVTFNPAIDYIVYMKELEKGSINRSERETAFFGGKGINVSFILNGSLVSISQTPILYRLISILCK